MSLAAVSPSNSPFIKPRHNILISIPRTASNLVTHLLTLRSQPSILAHPRDGYFFVPALSARFKTSSFAHPLSVRSPEERTSLAGALGHSASAWETWLADAEKAGRGTYVKEHVNWMMAPEVESSFLHADAAATTVVSEDPAESQTFAGPQNPTAVPDTLWTRTRATFLIRHPALTFPSTLRTAIDNEGLDTVLGEESESVMRWECTYKWHMLLYRFITSLASQSRHEPLIIDASQVQDLKFVKQYAHAVHLDPGLVRTSWSAVSSEEQAKLQAIERRMKDTLLASSGVVASKLSSQDIDIEALKEGWEAEFGHELAQRLERLVEGAMEEYQWLYERRWRG